MSDSAMPLFSPTTNQQHITHCDGGVPMWAMSSQKGRRMLLPDPDRYFCSSLQYMEVGMFAEKEGHGAIVIKEESWLHGAVKCV